MKVTVTINIKYAYGIIHSLLSGKTLTHSITVVISLHPTLELKGTATIPVFAIKRRDSKVNLGKGRVSHGTCLGPILPLICTESAFPQARELTDPNTFLLNSTL
ncbi:hypothetical protein XELAEV_18043534mg [Xenopus laevis]|uniref:Uncharacterized protein n=1 Tax=Xenopus laevis TaxID=8355 RepID=A0A974BX71_XENLA|nr:hypothetical protein XELAEV_18043534mg [Xenopus laevis]